MFTTTITPRVSETDGAGHVNNTVAPVWLEAGRREVFRIFSPALRFDDWHLALVNTNLDYVAQIYWQQAAEVRTWVDRVGNTSFRLYEEIWQGARLCVKGTVTYVHFDYATQRSRPVPAQARARLLEHRRAL
jgi:acyl-CoA thioester hydrolase